MRIGYMGAPLSFSEGMAEEMRDEYSPGAELVPLMSAKGTVDALRKGEIDMGVLAVRNSIFGVVEESEIALKGLRYRTLMERKMQIRQCIFVKDPSVKITKISSHVQALGQCRNSIDKFYPGAERIETADTALSAEMLADGRLPDDCAVVCRKEAGLHYGLCLAHEDAEDRKDNITDFILFELED
jgi:prephenate dehydratase